MWRVQDLVFFELSEGLWAPTPIVGKRRSCRLRIACVFEARHAMPAVGAVQMMTLLVPDIQASRSLDVGAQDSENGSKGLASAARLQAGASKPDGAGKEAPRDVRVVFSNVRFVESSEAGYAGWFPYGGIIRGCRNVLPRFYFALCVCLAAFYFPCRNPHALITTCKEERTRFLLRVFSCYCDRRSGQCPDHSLAARVSCGQSTRGSTVGSFCCVLSCGPSSAKSEPACT